jgi:hypothetical protein
MFSRLQKIHILLIALFSSIFVLVASWSGYADNIDGTGFLKRIEGDMGTLFTNPTSWSPYGNAGKLMFMDSSTENSVSASGIYLDTTNNTLSGLVWIETVWWTKMYPTKIVKPLGNLIDPWELQLDGVDPNSGYAWSENAGWISLLPVNSSYSWVYYLPLEQSFTGYAYSQNLGYIDFDPSGSLAGLSKWLRGKVKILGNIGGNSVYTDVFGDNGVTFDTAKFTPFLNQVKKNVTLMSRNIWARLNTSPVLPPQNVGNAILYQIPTNTQISSSTFLSKLDNTPGNTTETITIVGSDLYIDGDIPDNISLKKARVIIVLKDEQTGIGGNIYIGWSVKNIYTSLIAEWSLYSGKWPGQLYNGTKDDITNLPTNQLYIFGTVVSRNTIGWSTTLTAWACPLTLTISCTRNTAIPYDLNYFRTFDPIADLTASPSRRSDKSGYDESVIIEHDSRIISDPPLGIRTQ